MSARPKIWFHTLGCKVNFAESSTIARRFIEAGYERVQSHLLADVCVVNTCSVTEHSDKKGRNIVRRVARENPGALLVVAGCYAQLRPEALTAIPGVDIVAGNEGKGDIFDLVASSLAKKEAPVVACGDPKGFFPSYSSGERTRAFLKIQDGCSYRCAYCTIPLARGESRSPSIAGVVAQAREIAAAGKKEIVLTGINTGDFGRRTGESFLDLLRKLDAVDGIGRFRISSIEPNLLTDEIVAFTAASDKFQPHFHIPLQSGSDSVLARMRRRYTPAVFSERIGAVRRAMPDAFIGIDVITGFPGETEEEFGQTCDLLAGLQPSFLHVFPYSVRPGTPAAAMPGKVPSQVCAERTARLLSLSEKLHRLFSERFLGREAEVLFEMKGRDGLLTGFTGNYLKVRAKAPAALINTVSRVRLESSEEGGDLLGTLL